MSFAIHSLNNLHAGFLLLNSHQNSGQCIFQCLPFEAGMKDSLEAKLLTKLENLGMFDFRVTNGSDALKQLNSETNMSESTKIALALSIAIEISHVELPLSATIKELELAMAGVRFKLVKLDSTKHNEKTSDANLN